MDDKGFKTIEVKIFKGAVGNTEWWTDKDWENHNKYVEELKNTGEYMKEDIVYVRYKSYPPYDK